MLELLDLVFLQRSFQDILRLNGTLIKDPQLREFAHQHREEDSGHEKWFLQDLDFMVDTEKLTIDWLYGPDCSAIRDASYMIMAELLKAENDQQRTVLLLALESTSQVISKEVTSYVCDMGYGEKLKYFSKTHFEAENEHAMYEEDGEQQLQALKFTPQEKEKAIALVDHIYAIFYTITDALVKQIDKKDSLKFLPHIYAEFTEPAEKEKCA